MASHKDDLTPSCYPFARKIFKKTSRAHWLGAVPYAGVVCVDAARELGGDATTHTTHACLASRHHVHTHRDRTPAWPLPRLGAVPDARVVGVDAARELDGDGGAQQVDGAGGVVGDVAGDDDLDGVRICARAHVRRVSGVGRGSDHRARGRRLRSTGSISGKRGPDQRDAHVIRQQIHIAHHAIYARTARAA